MQRNAKKSIMDKSKMLILCCCFLVCASMNIIMHTIIPSIINTLNAVSSFMRNNAALLINCHAISFPSMSGNLQKTGGML